VSGRELSEEEVQEMCRAAARDLYRLPKVYAEVRALAYFPTTGEVKVSGGAMSDPTADMALDLRRAQVRRELVKISDLIALVASATAEALADLRWLDRMSGEPVGTTGIWTTETADRAEERSAHRRARRRASARVVNRGESS